MKRSNSFYFIFSMFVAVMFIFASCTKEGPAGPSGANGTDGTDGTNGTDGVDGTAGCITCHDADQTISLKEFQWESSMHAAGTALSRSSSASCAGCHSEQGFFQTDGNNPETEDTWEGVDDPMLLTCFTCHPVHETYTYADVQDLNYPEQPNWAVTHDKTIDMDLGKANLCAHCHQSRTRTPVVDMDNLDAMYSGISTHYGPHYSPQANLMGSFGAYEIPGSASYTAENYHLNAEDGCVSCHMRYSTANGTGGHNMTIDASGDLGNSCKQCHDSGNGAQDKYEEYYHEVFATIDHGDDGNTLNTTSYYTKLGDALTAMGVYTKVVDSVAGEPEDVHYNINTGLEINGTVTAAMFNHRYLYQDHSHGMHNPWYAEALLKNSLAAVEAIQ